MSEYHPDRWVVISVQPKDQPKWYRVFATWWGGFATGDSWQLNSGIVQCYAEGNKYVFQGESGSLYYCGNQGYGTSGFTSSVLNTIIDHGVVQGCHVEILDENTDWLSYDWSK